MAETFHLHNTLTYKFLCLIWKNLSWEVSHTVIVVKSKTKEKQTETYTNKTIFKNNNNTQ